MVYRSPSNPSEDNNHLSHFILNFSVDREVILIGDLNLPSTIWSNSHPFQGDFKPTTQPFVVAFASSGLSHWVIECMFFRSGNISDLVFTLAIDPVSDVSIYCPFPHCEHYPIFFDYVYDFSYELTPKKNV